MSDSQQLSAVATRLKLSNESAQALFARLGLPQPHKGNYFVTSDGGLIVLLNKFGMTVRIGALEAPGETYEQNWQKKLSDLEHPAVLQPVAAFNWEHLRVEILPGIRLGFDHNDVQFLKRRLEEDGYEFIDPKVGNIGYLNVRTERHKNGLPVVLDRNAVKRVKDVPVGRDDDEYAGAQTHLRQQLGSQFGRSTESGKMGDFWAQCARLKEAGVLHAGWDEERFSDIVHYHAHGETTRAQERSRKYAGQLDEYLAQHPLPVIQTQPIWPEY